MAEEFEFRLDVPTTRVTEQQILDSLRVFAALRGNQAFTTRDFDKWPDKVCSSCTVLQRLGGWRQALARAGVDGAVRAFRYSPEELMDNLELVWRELGRPPGQPSLSKYGYRISAHPYIVRWGSLRNACVLLSRFKQGQVSEAELLGVAPERHKRQAVSLKVRWDILKRDHYRCVRCGARPPDVELEVDHILPVARGGGNDLGNLQTLCRSCNQGKKDR